MKIYKYESLLGLENKIINSNNTIASCHIATADELFDDKEEYLNHKKELMTNRPDLMEVWGILVTTNKNKNDDYFSPADVWMAKNTPIYKPCNVNHNGKESDEKPENIGVIFDCYPVNDEYERFNASGTDNLPSKYHLLVGMYLWEKYFPKATSKIKEAMDNNEMYISMECLFKDFGYVLEDDSGTCNLIPRMDATSWLTASLRVYGGKGIVNIAGKNYKVGRWLKDMVFSGVGFVPKPANAESILFQDYISMANMKFNDNNEIFDQIVKIGVLNFSKGKVPLWPI